MNNELSSTLEAVYDLVIKDGTIVTADAVYEADLAVSGETIAAIGCASTDYGQWCPCGYGCGAYCQIGTAQDGCERNHRDPLCRADAGRDTRQTRIYDVRNASACLGG